MLRRQPIKAGVGIYQFIPGEIKIIKRAVWTRLWKTSIFSKDKWSNNNVLKKNRKLWGGKKKAGPKMG